MDEKGDERDRDKAGPPQAIAHHEIERQHDRNHRPADIDGEDRPRPVDRDRREERHADDFHHLARDDVLFGQPDERQVDVGRRAAKPNRISRATKGSRPSAEEARLSSPICDQEHQRDENGEEQRHNAGADAESSGDGSRSLSSGRFRARRRLRRRRKAAMILSACGRRASAFWNGPPGGLSGTPVQRGST